MWGWSKGKLIINNEKEGKNGFGDKDVMIIRDEAAKKTYYEVKLTAKEILKKGKFQKGMEFGVGIVLTTETHLAKRAKKVGADGIVTLLSMVKTRTKQACSV